MRPCRGLCLFASLRLRTAPGCRRAAAASNADAWRSRAAGIVKEVPSGDCMIIMGTNWSSGPPPTKMVCLAGLEVPRVGRRDTPDEPFAFGAREFLRKKVIGKTVQFRIDYVVPGGTRELGVVMLGNENLAESLVGAGWACVLPRSAGLSVCSAPLELRLTPWMPSSLTASCARRASRTTTSRPWQNPPKAPSLACGSRCVR